VYVKRDAPDFTAPELPKKETKDEKKATQN